MHAKDYRTEVATTKKMTDEPKIAYRKSIDGLVDMMYWGARPGGTST